MIKFDTQDIPFGTIESDITNIFELILPLPNILYYFELWKTECGILFTKPNWNINKLHSGMIIW